jgi:hypothetical protein
MDGQVGRRIHITGGPGSGKTTLARQVAARLQAPWYELDQVGYEGGAGRERPMEVRLADVRQIANQSAWVTEGIFLVWTDELFKAADRVVWLDLPWRLVGWRILMRHVMAELRGNNRHSGWLKLYRFLQWSRLYYMRPGHTQDGAPGVDTGENRAMTEQYLTAFKDKLVRCTSRAEVKAFNECLSPVAQR